MYGLSDVVSGLGIGVVAGVSLAAYAADAERVTAGLFRGTLAVAIGALAVVALAGLVVLSE